MKGSMHGYRQETILDFVNGELSSDHIRFANCITVNFGDYMQNQKFFVKSKKPNAKLSMKLSAKQWNICKDANDYLKSLDTHNT